MGIFDNLLCNLHIFFKRMLGTVIHDGRESAVNAGLADFIGRAMVKMKGRRDFRIILKGNLYKAYNIFLACIVTGAFRGLENDRGLLFLGSFHNALDDFHVVHIESADGVMTFVSFLKHFSSSNKRHSDNLPFKQMCMKSMHE